MVTPVLRAQHSHLFPTTGLLPTTSRSKLIPSLNGALRLKEEVCETVTLLVQLILLPPNPCTYRLSQSFAPFLFSAKTARDINEGSSEDCFKNIVAV